MNTLKKEIDIMTKETLMRKAEVEATLADHTKDQTESVMELLDRKLDEQRCAINLTWALFIGFAVIVALGVYTFR